VGDGARLMREAITSQSRGHQWEEGPRLYPAGNQLDEGGNQLGTWAMSAAVC